MVEEINEPLSHHGYWFILLFSQFLASHRFFYRDQFDQGLAELTELTVNVSKLTDLANG